MLMFAGLPSLLAIALVAGYMRGDAVVAATQAEVAGRATAPQASPVATAAHATNGAETGHTAQPGSKPEAKMDSEKLLALAVALKAEVDKTNKDMLSVSVVRKAQEIEKLARAVRERSKYSGGPG